VRILDRSLTMSSAPTSHALRDYLPTTAPADSAPSFFQPEIPMPLSPHMLTAKAAMQLKLILSHAQPPDSPAFYSAQIWSFLNQVKSFYAPSLSLTEHIANRYLLIAHYFGDLPATRFWLVFLHSAYAHHNSTTKTSSSSSSPTGLYNHSLAGDPSFGSIPSLLESQHQQHQQHQQPLFSPSRAMAGYSMAMLPSLSKSAPVIDDDTFLDVLREGDVVLSEETRSIATAAQNLPKHSRYESTKRIAWNYSVLGDRVLSVSLLTQTPPDHPNFYPDILRACVIAASISPEEYHKTVLFGATNLLATEFLYEGVQLLLLVGRGLDACTHLQNRGHWNEAARIAKTSLPRNEAALVFRRWANHLITQSGDTRDLDGSIAKDLKMLAIEILLTLGRYHHVLQLLHRDQHFDLAAQFNQACLDFFKVPDVAAIGLLYPSLEPQPELAPLPNLLESIHLDFAYFLHGQDTPLCRNLANHYWGLAGEVGQRTKDMVLAEARAKPAPQPAPVQNILKPSIPPSSAHLLPHSRPATGSGISVPHSSVLTSSPRQRPN
ncbi:MAG: hypothetical protein Q8P67_16230, partial [archaeon]|nr:hypothetical protein [archaeon]